MVKYAMMSLALAMMFVAVDSAQARGRRGGCPGGVCGVPVAPAKTAAVTAEPAVASSSDAATPVVAAPLSPRYTTSPRRLFGRR